MNKLFKLKSHLIDDAKKASWRLLIGLLVGLIWPLSAGSQTLVEQLHQAYHDVNYFQADFEQHKQIAFLSKPLVSSGRLIFAKNQGLIWQLEKPLWSKTRITDEGVFKSNKYQHNKKVTDHQVQALGGILQELLSAELNQVKSRFHINEPHIDEQQGRWYVTLTAKNKMVKKAIKSIVLQGKLKLSVASKEKSVGGIEGIIITEQNDDQTKIQLTHIVESKQPLSEEQLGVFN